MLLLGFNRLGLTPRFWFLRLGFACVFTLRDGLGFLFTLSLCLEIRWLFYFLDLGVSLSGRGWWLPLHGGSLPSSFYRL
ncbi:hypothetical protein BDN72DRAFT_565279 [Pluteus cervinus]|uniref:Uncharacterized protein n=1 Tax=Pluteus cervinus TaxID=181527 RepID=A0ACD3BCC9_9AGAR|nr:hypothetical protein BDN72DRAFT_565279 [Pluteus cervinus]